MNMTERIRQTIRERMSEQGLTQEELGERVGMSQPNVARALSGRSGSIPDTWRRILEELGLELIAVPKDSNSTQEGEV